MPDNVSPKERLTRLLSRCHGDPDLFNRAILARPPYWWRQREIAQSIVDYRITVAYSGNSIGKDFLVGGIIPWWLYTRYQSLVIVTGPSQSLLGSVTWKEVRRAIEGAKVPLKPKLSNGVKASPQSVAINSTGWQALGYSTKSVERASGQHAGQLLVIGEEASGIEDEIYDAMDGLKYTKLFLVGNPIRATGRFVELIRQADKDRRDGLPKHKAVNAIRVPSTDSPHAHLDHSPYGLADKTWLDDSRRRYGETSLWFRSHVLAEIPEVSSDVLILGAWLDWAAAQPSRDWLPLNHPVHRTRRISCDLGEGVGRDSSAIIVRDDLGILEVVCGSGIGLEEAAEIVYRLSRKYQVPQHKISYDRVGIGRDFGHLLAARGLFDCLGYAGESTPRDPHGFTNLRSEAAWNLRRRLDPNLAPDPRSPHGVQAAFAIPPGPWWGRLRDELKALSYDLVGRQTRLIPKKNLCQLLGHSPDLADALIQSFAFD